MSRKNKNFIIVLVLVLLALALYWFVYNVLTATVPIEPTPDLNGTIGEAMDEYKEVPLSEVMNNASLSVNVKVRTTGTIASIVDGEFVLSDDLDNYLLVRICRACRRSFMDILPSLEEGQKVEVRGVAGTTTPNESGLAERHKLAMPDRIGAINLGYDSNNIRIIE